MPSLDAYDAAMGSDDDEAGIFSAATTLIEQHGEGAALVAAGHAESALRSGDPLAARQWERIGRAIERLQAAERDDAP